ncbi:hypothetical protein [Clostridium estertheticum]|uniref:DUF3592 domain-containing protein n=1 Tax=Clostridium estertheticum TaxID=238834 RepID=A0A7Y3STH3_9CLOT|nr:hypothetical protein [Clostridium estertheticum]NNU75080.1 hypothetical protein [Clostridium estertheticum]WBL48447.1 hypothetical protein LOR37_07270 [Clostridium estertheticum]
MIIALLFLPFVLMGVIPLLIGLRSYKKGKKYDSESKVIVGEIVDVVRGDRVLDDPAGWFPTIKYWDDRTNSYLFYKSTTGHELKCKFTISNKAELRYLYTDKGVDIRANKSIAIYGIGKQLMWVGAIIGGINMIILITVLIVS